MPTKAGLVTEIYLLLATIHLNHLVMSPEMAQQIFERWPVVIGERPESPEAVMESYNAILQQRPARIFTPAPLRINAATPAETHPTQSPQQSQIQTVFKNEIKIESAARASQSEKVIESAIKDENTPQPAQNQKLAKPTIKDENTPEPSSQKHKVIKAKDSPSPFNLASHSRQHKPTPKPTLRATPNLEPKITPTRILKFKVSTITCKEEHNDGPPPSASSSVTPLSSTTKRAFIDLSNDSSSDKEDETPSKAPRIR